MLKGSARVALRSTSGKRVWRRAAPSQQTPGWFNECGNTVLEGPASKISMCDARIQRQKCRARLLVQGSLLQLRLRN